MIPKPRPEVFAFFADAFNLERITPQFAQLRVVTPPPITMRAGTLIEHEMRLYGVKLHWLTKIAAFESPSLFVDIQLKGPYRHWEHRHIFEEVPEGTRMRDVVVYELRLGPLGRLAHWALVQRSLETIFAYRNAAIGKIFGN